MNTFSRNIRPRRTMSIMYTSDRGTFFTESFLQNVEEGKNFNRQDVRKFYELSDSAGMTVLHFAASYGNTELVKKLISAGTDVNIQNRAKQTPLMCAVEKKHEKTIKMLLKFNADMFMPDARGQCALAKSFEQDIDRFYLDYSKTIKTLLTKVTVKPLRSSKHVESQAFHRHCPLYRFIELPVANKEKVIEVLLEKGSPVDAKCPSSGNTALHCAVTEQCLETVKLLVEYKADVNAINDDGYTPLTIYPMYPGRRDKIFKVLIDAGAVLINRVSGISMGKDLLRIGTRAMVRYALQSGIDVRLRDHSGKTPLHYLAKNDEENIFEELQNYNFDVHIRCRYKQRTMLHYAVSKRVNLSSVKFLLDHGANVNARDYENATPLCSCAFDQHYYNFYSDEYLNCIELLLERGADPHIFTKDHSDSYIEENYDNTSDKMLLPIFAKLALYEASERRIETFTREHIQSHPSLQKLFDSVELQLEQMKQITISQHSTLTLYDFITANHRISRFARNKDLVSDLTEAIEAYNQITYYRLKLQQLLSTLNQLLEWRQVTLDAVIDVFRRKTNLSVGIVSEEVVDHLLEEKWREMFWSEENATVTKIVLPPKTKRFKLSHD